MKRKKKNTFEALKMAFYLCVCVLYWKNSIGFELDWFFCSLGVCVCVCVCLAKKIEVD